MSVIADLRIPADSFELGRILEIEEPISIDLETMVPVGQKAVPFFWVYDDGDETFIENISKHPTVDDVRMVDSHNDRTLYALQWQIERDLVFEGLAATGAQIMGATGTAETWEFEIRFPTHASLSEFREHCENAHIKLDVGHVYNPTKPGSGPWYGLTDAQRETLVLAVENGYYSLPRGVSTQELAEELDISDQAVTERLRRAIATLVENTLLASTESEASWGVTDD